MATLPAIGLTADRLARSIASGCPGPEEHEPTDRFSRGRRWQPGQVAVFWGDAEFVYRHIENQAAWVAHRLTSAFGVRPGDRVGIWLRNCPEYLSALFGILGAGAVVVPINNFLKDGRKSDISWRTVASTCW